MNSSLFDSEFVKIVVENISAFSGSRTLPKDHRVIPLSYLDVFPPRPKLQTWKPQDLIHQLYHHVGFDVDRLLLWRFEHKLVQAQLLSKYVPGAVPETYGFFAEMRGLSPAWIRDRISTLSASGYIIKMALGEQSGESETVDKSDYLIRHSETLTCPKSLVTITEESYIIQRRLSIIKEYRVHSLEDQVISSLTFYRYLRTPPPNQEVEVVNDYVNSILASLPDGLVAGALLGWDIALTPDGNFFVIEANPAGHHTVCNPGFQCSGYFHSSESLARLLYFMHSKYGLQFDIIAPELPSSGSDLHWWVRNSYLLLQHLSSLYSRSGVVPASTSMRWIDVRISPAHNSFAWIATELQTIVESLNKRMHETSGKSDFLKGF